MKPKVISHRGANRFAPQNTIPAFQKSIELNVDGFETDVHLTKDGVPVLCHNYTVNATSNRKGNITDFTLNEIRTFDFGSYFSDVYKGTKIPTVDEFLFLCETADIDVLNIELKSPKDKTELQIVSETIELVKNHNLFDKLLISSFNPDLLVEAKKCDSQCKTGLLYSPNHAIAWKINANPVEYAKNIGAEALHPFEFFVNEKYVYNAHENGLIVNPWTIDKTKSIDKMILCGVDGIITNVPDVVQTILSKWNFESD